MLIRLLLIAALSIGLAGFGGITFLSMRGPASEARAEPLKVSVLVVTRQLQAGTLLKPDDLATREMLQDAVPEGANPDTPENRRSLNGAMIRRGMGTSDPVLSGDVTRPGDHGFLAAVLMPGMRAVTVGVDAISGSAGLIWPGDRIDVILTQALEGADVPLSRRVSAETVLHDVRVIAIDQRLVQGAVPGPSETAAARTVSVEVTPEQAGRVAVAVRIGRLSLSVRAAAGRIAMLPGASGPIVPASQAGTEMIWAGDVSHALPEASASAVKPQLLRIFQGSADGKEYRF